MVAKRANTPRNHEFRIWNIFSEENIRRASFTPRIGAPLLRISPPADTGSMPAARSASRWRRRCWSLIATRHLRKLFHRSELHLAKSLQLICRKNLLLILQTARRQIRQSPPPYPTQPQHSPSPTSAPSPKKRGTYSGANFRLKRYRRRNCRKRSSTPKEREAKRFHADAPT